MEWQEHFSLDYAFLDCVTSVMPREQDAQQLLRDTEEKLKLNACCIQQSLRELQVKLGDSWTGDRVPGSTEWFSPRSFSCLRPVSTPHQDLLDFLRAMQQYLKAEEHGREDVVLQLLVDISSQCGVAFPSHPPLTSLQSSLPPHAVREEIAFHVLETWEDVRLILQTHLLDQLQVSAEGAEDSVHISHRVFCLQRLLFLYPEAEVLCRFQSLRSKAVESLLHQSPTLDKGFDKVAHSFKAALPLLCRMVREDLLTLSSVAEPKSILSFINQVYLSIISQELSALLGKEHEKALKDNSTHSNKGRKSSAKIRPATDAAEEQRKERSFYLTAHQLRCLTQVTSTLLELEGRLTQLVTDLTLITCTTNGCSGVKGVLRKVKEDSDTPPAECSGDMLLLQYPEPFTLEFDWRGALKELVGPIAHCVKVVLENVCSKNLQEEESAHALCPALITLSCTHQVDWTPQQSCPEETPRMIAKFCGDIMEELEAMLPLAVACQDDCLLGVRSSYIEACGLVTSAVLHRLEERSTEVPSSAPLRNLPVLLASSVHILQCLSLIEARLKNVLKVPLSLLPISRCQEVMETLQAHLVSYCVNVCATSLMQDPEGHYWADPKPFYEGDRCSFSIQMWNYFLVGLRSDLWRVLPPTLAQRVLAQILSQTLEMFVQRYTLACPTYQRSLQVRFDITAILLCVEQLIWSVCDGPMTLLNPGSQHDSSCSLQCWVRSIHILCNQLLSVLTLTTAPLPELLCVFRVDPKDIPSSPPQVPSLCTEQWLKVIHPDLFPQELLQTSAADEHGALLLKMLFSQPGCNYKLLLLAILQSDCLLLRLLFECSYVCLDGENPKDQSEDAFTEALFFVLITLNDVPKALGLVFGEYFDKRHMWDYIFNMTDSGRVEPVVMKFLRAVLAKPALTLVSSITTMIRAKVTEEPTCRTPESLLNKVPKEWNYTPYEAKGKKASTSSISLVMNALSFIITNLPTVASCLPLPLRYLFYLGEKHLSQRCRQMKPTGLLVWCLLGYLCQALESPGKVEGFNCLPLNQRCKETLALCSECLKTAIGQQKGVPKPMVHKVLQGMEESQPKLISIQLQKARKICSKCPLKPTESSVLQERGNMPELAEQKISLMLLEICHKPGGAEYLRQIYHIIQLNEELLESRLSGLRGSGFSKDLVKFKTKGSFSHGPHLPFNPFIQFNRFGSRNVPQSAIKEWNWAWDQLLLGCLGMSQVTLKALLAKRWDMQDSAVLEEEERALVDHLKKVYLRESLQS